MPEGDFRHIMVKPNWVKHQELTAFPIEALVTSSTVIEGVVDACLERYPLAEDITVGDVPLQSCDWGKLRTQAGIDRLEERFSRQQGPRVSFLDLRKERYESVGGFLRSLKTDDGSDPEGYAELDLDNSSYLEPVTGRQPRFRVADFDPKVIGSAHRRSHHRYLVAGSVLKSDLFLNLPKIKTHNKAGITASLKNLVGINAQKGYLAHYQQGMPNKGGDEFPPEIRKAIVVQSRIREALQKRSPLLFWSARPIWLLTKRILGIHTYGEAQALGKRFYIAGGGWYGNDTIWRMVYDLNKAIVYAPRSGGTLSLHRQREYLTIMDGITAGEGNGPLQPLPVDLGVLMVGSDPFATDMAVSRLIGFDWHRIPLLSNHQAFGDPRWGAFDPDQLPMRFNDHAVAGLTQLPVLRRFLAPPGWRGRIEI